MKNVKKIIAIFFLIGILASIPVNFLVAWDQACMDGSCNSILSKSCNLVCKLLGGCNGYIYAGACEHGICLLDVTFFCRDKIEYGTVICVGPPCPL